jgi:hypothetical protein
MWGTDINLQELEAKFRSFLLSFEDETGTVKYAAQLRNIANDPAHAFHINSGDILAWD